MKARASGMRNLQRHVENLQTFGFQPVMSINLFHADTPDEIELVENASARLRCGALMADHWAMGGEGAADVARAVVEVVENGKSKLKLLYPDDMPLLEKIRTIARTSIAQDITADKAVRDQLAQFEQMGLGKAPVCIAKTQYSFTTNADTRGRPTTLWSTCARCGSPAPSSWSRSAARS